MMNVCADKAEPDIFTRIYMFLYVSGVVFLFSLVSKDLTSRLCHISK